MLNGVDELIMMKSDVLNGMDQIAACTAYTINGERSEQVPSNMCNDQIEPNLEWFPGWGEDLSHTQGFEAMDQRFRNYVHFVENYLGTKIRVISLGPERESTLVKD
jgi:adenylosuccinate synthase